MVDKSQYQHKSCKPGENATCVQEGVSSAAATPTPKPTTTTLEVRKVCLTFRIPPPQPPCNPQPPFTIQITGNNNPQPSTFIITGGSSQLVTLSPVYYVTSFFKQDDSS